MERQAQRWKQLKDEASRIEEGIRKPNVGKNEKLLLVLEYLIWAMEHFPDQKDPREDPEADAIHHMVAALWDALKDFEWPSEQPAPSRKDVKDIKELARHLAQRKKEGRKE
jgi:hypothetical protein